MENFSNIFYKGIKLDSNKPKTEDKETFSEKNDGSRKGLFIFKPSNSLPLKEKTREEVSSAIDDKWKIEEVKKPLQIKNSVKGEQLRPWEIRPVFKKKAVENKGEPEKSEEKMKNIEPNCKESDKSKGETAETPVNKKEGKLKKARGKKGKKDSKNAKEGTPEKKEAPDGGKEEEEGKKKLSKRKFKAHENFVAINMKRKYKERFRGNIQKYRTKFAKNGKPKIKFKKYGKAAADGEAAAKKGAGKFEYFQEEEGGEEKKELMLLLASKKGDMYFNCLSSGLKIDLTNYEEEERDENTKLQLNRICERKEFSQEDMDFVTRNVFGHNFLFDFQKDALDKILKKNRSVLVSMPTGFGKSLIYQFSALLLDGMTLVITPFLSLMFDQLSKLPRLLPGACLNSMLTVEKKRKILELASKNQIKILYLTPEMFETDLLELIAADTFPKISLICIDEIHCISEFSHSFRIAFVKLSKSIKLSFPSAILVGLTATANKVVLKNLCATLSFSDIVGEKLRPQEKQKIKPYLISEQAKFAELKKILESFPFCNFHSILIFVTFKYTAQRLYHQLTNNGIKDCFYYSPDLEEAKRMEIHENFMKSKIKILIVTASFSMGLDKSDIQGVIHYNMPKSVESLIQEIGRAGRGSKVEVAESVVFFDQMEFFGLRGLLHSDSIRSQNINIILKAVFLDESSANEQQPGGDLSGSNDPAGNPKINIRKRNKIEDEQSKKKDDDIKFKRIETKNKSNIKALEIKALESALNIKKEAIEYFFIKLEEICGSETFKFLRIPWEYCSLRFYRTKSDDLKQSSFLIQYAVENCKSSNGCYKLNLIKICVELDKSFHQVTRELKRLYFDHKVFYELEGECVCFEVPRQLKNEDYLRLWMEMNKSFEKKEKSQIYKLDALYLILYKTIASNKDFFKEVIERYFFIEDEDLEKLFEDPYVSRFFPFLPISGQATSIKEDVTKFFDEFVFKISVSKTMR